MAARVGWILESLAMAHPRFTCTVSVAYLPEQSQPQAGVHAFAYTVTIVNSGDIAAQLVARHWIVADANGHTEEVRGLAVVGHQPLLKPGEKFLADLSDGASIKPYIGMKLSGKMFSAETMRLVNSEIIVVGQETIAVGGQALRAYKILEKNAMMPSTLYASDAGELLRADLPMGMQLPSHGHPRVTNATQCDSKTWLSRAIFQPMCR